MAKGVKSATKLAMTRKRALINVLNIAETQNYEYLNLSFPHKNASFSAKFSNFYTYNFQWIPSQLGSSWMLFLLFTFF